MHLLISAAQDVTADLICERLGNSVLRVNWERWNEYDLDITPSSFRISDGFGRRVTESTLGNIIWRKPVQAVDPHPGEFYYCFHEFKAAIRAIVEQVRKANPRRLPIDPNRNATIDKFKQLQCASRYLSVPKWLFTSSPAKHQFIGDNWVVKSVTGEPIPNEAGSKVIYTSSATPSLLSDGFPWFVQEKIEAAYDVTVVYVDGELFPFMLDRSLFPDLDWRRSIGQEKVDKGWVKFDLPSTVGHGLSSLMSDLGLRFGRIDLLASDVKGEEFWFLEVNPNGQWAWLDMAQDNGLFDTVVRFLTSA